MTDRLLWLGGGLVALLVSIGAALEGRTLAADRDIADALRIAAEDRETCARLSAGPGTARFSACALELSWVRSQERRRLAAGAAVLP